jgi:small-conductance mechanosensitive channel
LQSLYETLIVNRFKNDQTREFLRIWGSRIRYTIASLGAATGFAAAGGDFSSLVGGGTIFIGAAALAGKDLAVHYLSGGTLNVEGNFAVGDYVEGDGFKGYIIARTYRITTFVEFIDKNDKVPSGTPVEAGQPLKEPPRLDDVLTDPDRYVAILHRIPNTKLTDRTGEWISHHADPEKLRLYFAHHNTKPGQKKIPLEEYVGP